MLKTKSFALTLFILTFVSLIAPVCSACFSIVVGKDASADGYVLVAHNEDDSPPQIVNHHKVLRKQYKPGDKLKLRNGGLLDQAEQTCAYLWSEMPGMNYSDSFINEHGVTVTSNNCPSREDKPEITDGGIGYMLRALIAQRAKTAREGVILAGQLVEKFGYVASGRTYIIADPHEGWLFAVVNGKHYLAKRVPDNHVAMVANTYTIKTIRRSDLADTENILASKDIIDYAIQRGWYQPDRVSGPFNFRLYANPDSALHPSNLSRLWRGLNCISKEPISCNPNMPFSIIPKQKVTAFQLMQILRDDNDIKKSSYSSLTSTLTLEQITKGNCEICSGNTQTSFVAQLRAGLPLDTGIVYWMCLAPPKSSIYIPYYYGISDFPAGFKTESKRPSNRTFKKKTASKFTPNPFEAFWTFSNFQEKVSDAKPETIARIQSMAKEIEQSAFAAQKALEQAALLLTHEQRADLLTNYSKGLYLTSLEAMDKILSE
jgi:dipeptidase